MALRRLDNHKPPPGIDCDMLSRTKAPRVYSELEVIAGEDGIDTLSLVQQDTSGRKRRKNQPPEERLVPPLAATMVENNPQPQTMGARLAAARAERRRAEQEEPHPPPHDPPVVDLTNSPDLFDQELPTKNNPAPAGLEEAMPIDRRSWLEHQQAILASYSEFSNKRRRMDQEEGRCTTRLLTQANFTSTGGGASGSSDWPSRQRPAAPAQEESIDESILAALAQELGQEVDSQEEEIPPPWHPRYHAWEARQSG